MIMAVPTLWLMHEPRPENHLGGLWLFVLFGFAGSAASELYAMISQYIEAVTFGQHQRKHDDSGPKFGPD